MTPHLCDALVVAAVRRGDAVTTLFVHIAPRSNVPAIHFRSVAAHVVSAPSLRLTVTVPSGVAEGCARARVVDYNLASQRTLLALIGPADGVAVAALVMRVFFTKLTSKSAPIVVWKPADAPITVVALTVLVLCAAVQGRLLARALCDVARGNLRSTDGRRAPTTDAFAIRRARLAVPMSCHTAPIRHEPLRGCAIAVVLCPLPISRQRAGDRDTTRSGHLPADVEAAKGILAVTTVCALLQSSAIGDFDGRLARGK